MSVAEWFLLAWAMTATLVAGWLNNKTARMFKEIGAISGLLADVATGDVVAHKRDDGVYVVENDEIKLAFKRRGD